MLFRHPICGESPRHFGLLLPETWLPYVSSPLSESLSSVIMVEERLQRTQILKIVLYCRVPALPFFFFACDAFGTFLENQQITLMPDLEVLVLSNDQCSASCSSLLGPAKES